MRAMIVSFFLVGIGGAVGAMARLGMSILMQRVIFIMPLGTFVSNLAGCFIMGMVLHLLAKADWFDQSGLVSDQNRLIFAVGFCGSFTTLSSMIVELNTLMQRDDFFAAFVYLFATMLGGFACFFAGIALIRTLLQSQAA